jgi:hypothetical protein
VRSGIRKRFGSVALSAEEDAEQGRLFGPRYIWNLSRRPRVGERAAHRREASEGDRDRDGDRAGFQENYLLSLIRDLCYRSGIALTEECSRQLSALGAGAGAEDGDGPSLLGFEFVTADVVDIVPLVKHMHQVGAHTHSHITHTGTH